MNRRRKPQQPDMSRQIGRALKKAHLTDEPSFHLKKGRNNDPPPYSVDVSYVRKVRLTGTTRKTLIAEDILRAVFPNVTIATPPFTRLMITRIEAWGPATMGDVLYLVPLGPLLKGKENSNKDFVDTGTSGARRPHIVLEASPKDLAWCPVSIKDPLILVEAGQTGDFDKKWIIDLLVHFTDSQATSPERDMFLLTDTPSTTAEGNATQLSRMFCFKASKESKV